MTEERTEHFMLRDVALAFARLKQAEGFEVAVHEDRLRLRPDIWSVRFWKKD